MTSSKWFLVGNVVSWVVAQARNGNLWRLSARVGEKQWFDKGSPTTRENPQISLPLELGNFHRTTCNIFTPCDGACYLMDEEGPIVPDKSSSSNARNDDHSGYVLKR